MYATGIGLVIEGLKRYYEEMSKSHEKEDARQIEHPEEEEQQEESEEVQKQRPPSFLKKIQDFFEKDDV
jgi:hypothetical protein